MKVIPKIYTRDFPVLLFQIWGRRYKSFFGIEIKTFPQNIYVFRRGFVAVYRNIPVVHDEINNVFKKKGKTDPKFFKCLTKVYLEKSDTLKAFMDTAPITRKNLLKFADDLCELWHGLYASLYIPTDETMSATARNSTLKLRQKTERLEYKFFGYIEKALRIIYPSLGDFAKYISWEELSSNRIPAKDQLKKRADTLVILGDKLISKAKLHKLEKTHNFILESELKVKGLTEFKGQVAFRGKVKGLVRKILKVSDVLKIKSNEILVSYMTIPDFLPAMIKAAAFVTDEGGITCHAAIIAREMKKPCVIGTKIASKVLKDGDLIEVDANKGIVRILKVK